MSVNRKELKRFIQTDEAYTLRKICEHLQQTRAKEEAKVLRNDKRPEWNNNSKNVESPEVEYYKYDLEDRRKARVIYDEMVTNIKTIKDIKSVDAYKNKYEHYLASLLGAKLDMIRSDYIFAKWNISTNTLLAVNRFKNKLKAKTARTEATE
jgi:hypothetical protein